MLFKLKYSIWIFITFINVNLVYSSQSEIVDNMAIFDQLTESMIDQIIDSTKSKITDRIFIKNASVGTVNDWFIENWIIKVLSNNGHVPAILSNYNVIDTLKNVTIFEYKTKQLRVQYDIEKRFLWIKKITRKVTVEFEIKVFNYHNGEIYKFDNILKNYSDIINKKNFTNLQNKNITFTKAAINSDNKYEKIFEPFLVIATTGIVIYLFYSLRSK